MSTKTRHRRPPANELRKQVLRRIDRIIGTDATLTDNPDFEFLSRIRSKMRDCGKFGYICEEEGTNAVKICRLFCRSRLCPVCGRKRSMNVYFKIVAMVKKMKNPKFITLTLTSSSDPLDEQIQRLNKCFATLRRRRWWKGQVAGGVFTHEQTFNFQRDQFHPHIHMIVDTPYLDDAHLAEKWLEITGDSYVVDVREYKRPAAYSEILSAYISKTNDCLNVPDDRFIQWAREVHGLRLVNTFGIFHGMKPDEDAEKKRPKKIRVAPLALIEMKALEGDSTAKKLFERCRSLEITGACERIAELVADARAWMKDFENAAPVLHVAGLQHVVSEPALQFF